jgi:hypothetical protein
MVGLNRVTLQETHLLEVPDTPMGHLSWFTGSPRSEVILIDDSALQTSRCCIQHHTSPVSSSTHNENVKLFGGMELFDMLLTAFELKVELDEV